MHLRPALPSAATLLLALAAGCHKHPPTPAPRITPPSDDAVPPVLPAPEPPELPPRWPPRLSERLTPVHFAFDSAALDADARAALADDAAMLGAHPEVRVQIEGHCDERGSTEYNLALGERRADAVRDALAAAGVAGSRLATLSYGEERPVDPGHDEAAWAQNRRSELRVVDEPAPTLTDAAR